MVTQLPRKIQRADRSYRLESSIDNELMQPYVVKVMYGYEKHDEMYEWCSDRFGRHTKQWNNPRWCAAKFKSTFYFKNARDRTMFLMRWA